MKIRGKESQWAVMKDMVTQLKAVGPKPTFHMFNNKVSTHVLSYLKGESIMIQQLPVGCHSRNAAEWAIRTLKNHFIASPGMADERFTLNN